jgi:hypothetical protein
VGWGEGGKGGHGDGGEGRVRGACGVEDGMGGGGMEERACTSFSKNSVERLTTTPPHHPISRA